MSVTAASLSLPPSAACMRRRSCAATGSARFAPSLAPSGADGLLLQADAMASAAASKATTTAGSRKRMRMVVV